MRKSRTMSLLRKRVIVRKFSKEWLAGYAGANCGQNSAALEILDLSGKVVSVDWNEVKWVCYVRDFPAQSSSQSAAQANPEHLLHKRFSVRPRTAGLWLRMTLNDGEELEGLAANDRSLIDGVGLLLTPPDTRSNTQKIFLPRQAIQSLEVVSLIGVAQRKKPAAPRPSSYQAELFRNDSDASTI